MTGDSILNILKGRQMTQLELDEYFKDETAFEKKYDVDVVSEFYGERAFMGELLYRDSAFSPESLTNFEKDWIVIVSESWSDDHIDKLPKDCKFNSN